MRLVIIGASSGIGLATVRAALAAGHEVTAFSRHASSIAIQDSKLHFVDGDVRDGGAVAKLVKNHDTVICTLGLPTRLAIGPPFAGRSDILSRGTQNIIEAMEAEHVKRLLCVTAIAAGTSVQSCTPAARLGLRLGLRWLFKEKDRQEKAIKKSTLDWTIIRPTALTNSTHHRPLDDGKGTYGTLSHISREDVAREMIALLDDKASHRKGIILSYPPRLGDSLRWLGGYLKFN